MRRYRIGFALTTVLGNQTRYSIVEKYVGRHAEIDAVWAPIRHYLEPDPYRRFPGPLRKLLIARREIEPVTTAWSTLDAVLVHGFTAYCMLSLRRRPGGRPLLVINQDMVPFKDQRVLTDYGERSRNRWVYRVRHAVQCWFYRRADLVIPWTDWARRALVADCGVSEDKIVVHHTGVDLEVWPATPPVPKPVPRILFVGADFERKGGPLLLDVFEQHLVGRATLDIVSRDAPCDVPYGVTVRSHLSHSDGSIQDAFAGADLFALPTTADITPWVVLEAMATSRAVVSTTVCSIPELIDDGVSGFLVAPNDGAALADRLLRCVDMPASALSEMGKRGREIVEQRFDAERSVAAILATVISAVESRAPNSSRGGESS
jgi:glycosyltransferase involved in cell wall biosynthesis